MEGSKVTERGSVVRGEVATDDDHLIASDRPRSAAMVRLTNGARGSFWVTQAAAGVENSLQLRVSGSTGTLEWSREQPTRLIHKPIVGPAVSLTPNGPTMPPLAARSSRLRKGHPEGFHEAFANLYSDAAEAIAARRSGSSVDPLALHFPTAVDGALGVGFVEAVLASSDSEGVWTATPILG